MLIYFRTYNNYSYSGEVEFSMISGSYSELPENVIELPERYKNKASLLKSSVIFGANASGKSNLLKAITDGTRMIVQSTKDIQVGDKLPFNPYKNRFDKISETTYYHFGIFVEDSQFDYYFEFNENLILKESLTEYATQKPIHHFTREYDAETNNYKYSFSEKYFKGEKDKMTEITNSSSLYLSVAAQFNLPIAEKVFKWFKTTYASSINTISPGGISLNYTLNLIRENDEMKKLILNGLNIADFMIKDIKVTIDEVDKRNRFIATTYHEGLGADGKPALIPFDLFTEESAGTQRFLAWIGIFLDVLKNGKVLIIDELGNSMHTLLLRHLVSMFNSKETNPHNAQLIFTTHDTNIMDLNLLRRDQIWIVDREEDGSSNLFPISDFKIKKGKALESSYLQGVYGGIPHIFNN